MSLDLLNKIKRIIPINTKDIGDFISKLSRYNCNQTSIHFDQNATSDEGAIILNPSVEYSARTKDNRVIKFKQRFGEILDCPFSIVSAVSTEKELKKCYEKVDLDILLIESALPNIQINYSR